MSKHEPAAAVPFDLPELERAGLRRMLSEAQVLKIVPASSVTLWRMVRRKEFPPPSYISRAKKVWYLDEIIAWQSEVNGRGRRSVPKDRASRTTTLPEKMKIPAARG